MKFTEVEFKYKADEIGLTKFMAFCEDKKPHKVVQASGFDHFYANSKDTDSFCRHRVGPDMNQLTFKRKTSDSNNFVRTEHNLDLDKVVQKDQVDALCAEFGYKYNMSIFKTCFVYKYENYTLVYYICYDTEMKELGRFVEIEMAEEYNWRNESQAWGELLVMEKLCKPLGISPQSRIKRSLWEMFKK